MPFSLTSVKIDDSSFERVEDFKYLGTTLTNQNFIQEEIKSRLMSGDVCYHSVQNLLSYSLLTKNLKIKIYRIIILPVVVYGCKTWSLTLKKECRLRVFENRVLGRIFGSKRDEVKREWRRMRWAGHVAYMGERRGVYGGLVGKPNGKRPRGRPGVNGRKILRWIFRKLVVGYELDRGGSG